MAPPHRDFAAQPPPLRPLSPREQWTAVDRYITSHLPHDEAGLQHAVEKSQEGGLKDIAVSATQGKFLHLLALTISPMRIIEYGTLGGYSTIWLARALRDDPSSQLYTLELVEANAGIARQNLSNAGLADKVTVIVGAAETSADRLREVANVNDVDLFFIDADKERCSTYVAQCLAVSRPGSVIIVDNVIRSGAVIEENHPDSRVHGVRRVYEYLAELEAEGYLQSTAIQTVGEKNYDGFIYARVIKAKSYERPADDPTS